MKIKICIYTVYIYLIACNLNNVVRDTQVLHNDDNVKSMYHNSYFYFTNAAVRIALHTISKHGINKPFSKMCLLCKSK